MATPLRLRILTPHGTKFDGDVRMLEVKAPEGYIGLLANHSPFVANLNANVVYVTMQDGTREPAVTDTATVYANRDRVRLFALDFVFVKDIDFAKAQKAKDDLERRMRQMTDAAEAAKIEHKLAFELLKLRQGSVR